MNLARPPGILASLNRVAVGGLGPLKLQNLFSECPKRNHTENTVDYSREDFCATCALSALSGEAVVTIVCEGKVTRCIINQQLGFGPHQKSSTHESRSFKR